MNQEDADKLQHNRDQVEKKLKNSVVRLQDELDHMIKMCSFQREALYNEMMDGMGYKKEAVSDKFLGKLLKLTQTSEKLVDAKIRLDKSMKQLAENMTPEEERQAVEKYIQAMPHKERYHFIWKIKQWHIEHSKRQGYGVEDETPGS